MNRGKKYATLFLLFAFLSGQLALITHQHELSKCCGELSIKHCEKSGYHAHKPNPQNCSLCDVVINKKDLPGDVFVLHVFFSVVCLLYALTDKFWINSKESERSRGPPVYFSF